MATVSDVDILKKIKITENRLPKQQIADLQRSHTQNICVFNNDLSSGFQTGDRPFLTTFDFEHRPPPHKIWTPQYNRKCATLHQSKCDQLEEQGVLADPAEYGINVHHVSPCFIQQKTRAKQKHLQDCELHEVRFITSHNALNESIRAEPSKSNTYEDIMKFLARWNHHIFADLQDSYFQISVHQEVSWNSYAI